MSKTTTVFVAAPGCRVRGLRLPTIRRLLGVAVLSGIAALTGGCASLPAGVARVESVAIPASTSTALGRIASSSSPDSALSGFRLLPSGAFALSTRMELARRAERSLDLQYFLIKNDATGRDMLRALRDASRRGVRVRLLLDDLNTAGQDALLLGLAAHDNVQVRLYNPFPSRSGGMFTRFAASLFQFERLNHRMHNKLFIADGSMAVTGGRNVADEYFMRHPLANFIDLDVFATGAIVPELSSIFDRFWNSSAAYPLESVAGNKASIADRLAGFEKMTPLLEPPSLAEMPAEDVLGYGPLSKDLNNGKLLLTWGAAEVFADPPKSIRGAGPSSAEPDDGPSRVRLNVLEHIRDARGEVVLITPYLVPGRRGMDLLRDVRRRNVDVSILTNSLASTDQPLVHIGYRRYRGELLELGVELYELSPIKAGRESRQLLFGTAVGGLHTKAVIFDREEIFIGSMNFDPRSDHFNTEMGLFIHIEGVAREVSRLASVAKLQAAHRLRLTSNGAIEWMTPASADNEVHTEEPETRIWIRMLLNLLAPLAPDELL